MQQLTYEISRQRHAEAGRRRTRPIGEPTPRGPREVVIRLASAADDDSLRLLAALEGRTLSDGPWLYAETDGSPAAALRLVDGAVLANPFTRTVELRRVLDVWARELTGRRRRRWLPAL
jgi:hypothetical protein